MRSKEWDGDVFWTVKMMKFQNNGVWKRWVMDNGMSLSIKRGFVREIGKCENVYFVAK